MKDSFAISSVSQWIQFSGNNRWEKDFEIDEICLIIDTLSVHVKLTEFC
ncbi:MAG: hypothetical protein ACKO6A_04525 [Bacteroidota bacterium]